MVCNGYKMLYMPNHHRAYKNGCVYEHIVRAEEKLGRKLNDGEAVHHIDQNRMNNEFNNLLIFKTDSDHAAFHAGCNIELIGDVYIAIDKKNKEQELICPICGKQKSEQAVMCMKCRKERNMASIPTADELRNEVESTKSMVAIAMKYGVTDNAVRKWCKKYGIEYRAKLRKQK